MSKKHQDQATKITEQARIIQSYIAKNANLKKEVANLQEVIRRKNKKQDVMSELESKCFMYVSIFLIIVCSVFSYFAGVGVSV